LKKQRESKPLSELISLVSEGSKSTKSTQTQMGSDVAGSEDWELLSSSDSGNVKRKQPETIPNTPYDEPTETDPTEPHITHKKARTVACKHNIHPSPMIQFGDAPWVGPYPSLSTTVEATSVENNTEVGPIDFGENPSLRLSYPKGEATENDESPLPEETAKARTTNPYGILFGGFV